MLVMSDINADKGEDFWVGLAGVYFLEFSSRLLSCIYDFILRLSIIRSFLSISPREKDKDGIYGTWLC